MTDLLSNITNIKTDLDVTSKGDKTCGMDSEMTNFAKIFDATIKNKPQSMPINNNETVNKVTDAISNLNIALENTTKEVAQELALGEFSFVDLSASLANTLESFDSNTEDESEKISFDIKPDITDGNANYEESLSIADNDTTTNKHKEDSKTNNFNNSFTSCELTPLIQKNNNETLSNDGIADSSTNEILSDNELYAIDFVQDDNLQNMGQSEIGVKISTSINNLDLEEENGLSLDERLVKDLNIESLDTDVNNDSNNDSANLLMSQTPQELATKVMIASNSEFDINLETILQTKETASTTNSFESAPSKILAQISKQIEGLVSNNRVNIVLNPESLGKVSIQLIKTGEGLTAEFTASSNEARDLIMKDVQGLKESLVSHGINVNNISVKLNSTQESSYNSDWTEQEGSRGGNKNSQQNNKENREKKEFEQMLTQEQFDENGKV